MAACAHCQRTGRALAPTPQGGLCARCRHRQTATACAHCDVVKPVAGHTTAGKPICERCRRHHRGQRRCGLCGNTRTIARRARDGDPDVCVNCYRLPQATCHRCQRRKPCHFADGDQPICKNCAPRATARCAGCGRDRPPTARWPQGPVCEPCYRAALTRRGACAGCGQTRRLFERGRCAPCTLSRRTNQLLADDTGAIPAALVPVAAAIAAAPQPHSALNWLRKGAGAPSLADLAAGRLALTHEALDTHPRTRAADYLRRVLTAHGVLADRDEALVRLHRWIDDLSAGIDPPADRRLVRAYATWRVLRRLRRHAADHPQPRTPTHNAKLHLQAAADLLDWLARRDTTLRHRTHQGCRSGTTTRPCSNGTSVGRGARPRGARTRVPSRAGSNDPGSVEHCSPRVTTRVTGPDATGLRETAYRPLPLRDLSSSLLGIHGHTPGPNSPSSAARRPT